MIVNVDKSLDFSHIFKEEDSNELTSRKNGKEYGKTYNRSFR